MTEEHTFIVLLLSILDLFVIEGRTTLIMSIMKNLGRRAVAISVAYFYLFPGTAKIYLMLFI